MTRVAKIVFVMVFTLLITNSIRVDGFPTQSADFEFLTTDGLTVPLSDFQDKTIVLDWSASWCPYCVQNLKTFNSIYASFKNYTNFLTVSYGDSGDDIDKVISHKANYPWTFGLDVNNYADVANANNADVWILDTDLNVRYTWDTAVVLKSDFVNKLNDVVGEVVIEITSTTVSTSSQTITSTTTIIDNDKTVTSENVFTTETLITSETIITSSTSVNVMVDNNINTFGLFDNPFFIGFIALSTAGFIFVQFSRRRL